MSLNNLSEDEIKDCRIYLQYCVEPLSYVPRIDEKRTPEEWRKGYIVLPANIKELVEGKTEMLKDNPDTKEEGHKVRAAAQLKRDLSMFPSSSKESEGDDITLHHNLKL